jgi:hypothetical protein
MITARQVINDFRDKNKYMLGTSAIALASLLAIAPFNNAVEVRVTRESAISFLLLCVVIGRSCDVARETFEVYR